MDYSILLDLVTDLGYDLAMAGAETFRIEESVTRVTEAYGVKAEVFSIPNCLIVSIIGPDGQPITRMRRLGAHGNDLDNVENLSGLSRALCNRKPEPAIGLQWLDYVHQMHRTYSPLAIHAGYYLSAFGFTLLFGGSVTDALWSGLCGLVVEYVNKWTANLKASTFFTTISASFLMAFVAYLLGSTGLLSRPDMAIIGALMLLVPGLLFTNAMRDIIYGDTNSGVNRIVQVFLIAIALALGTGGAWNVVALTLGEPTVTAGIDYPILAQCLFSLFGCIGFSVLFNIHGPGSILCALGGCLCWAIYGLYIRYGGSELAAYFWASLFASVYAEIMARIRKYPAISYLVVSIFPLIPGAGVYYTMSYAVRGEMEQFANQGMFTAAIAGVMAVGILLGSTSFRMYSDYKSKQKKA